VGVQMMLSTNVVHLTLFRMGTLLVKSYEVYCEVLNRVWFALVVKISLEHEIGIYYWCHYIEYKNSLLLDTGGRYKSHWDRLSVFVLDARNVTIFAIEPTICILQEVEEFLRPLLWCRDQASSMGIASGDIICLMSTCWGMLAGRDWDVNVD
jgi:hypothetical protein